MRRVRGVDSRNAVLENECSRRILCGGRESLRLLCGSRPGTELLEGAGCDRRRGHGPCHRRDLTVTEEIHGYDHMPLHGDDRRRARRGGRRNGRRRCSLMWGGGPCSVAAPCGKCGDREQREQPSHHGESCRCRWTNARARSTGQTSIRSPCASSTTGSAKPGPPSARRKRWRLRRRRGTVCRRCAWCC